MAKAPGIAAATITADRVEGKPYLEILVDRAAIARHGLLEPGVNFLQKPFSPKDLAWHVRRALDTRP